MEAISDEQFSSPKYMLKVLSHIRGDFAFLYQRGDIMYIGKDEFGKKSLLVGF
jgi:asparagine synthetase B (glutamine-hydrolysing)